jgi:triosephosphate isomerase
MRRKLIAANWKMNLNRAQVEQLIGALRAGLRSAPRLSESTDIVVCPPFPYLFSAAKEVEGGPIRLGAQNFYFQKEGAFTGEVSAGMLADAGARYVIIGHSERRHVLGESDHDVQRKLQAALAANLIPILCVGETLPERQANETLEVLTFQTVAALCTATISSGAGLVVAYEPVWAIGTGQNATAQQAQQAHAHIRTVLRERFGKVDDVRILYGGSLKADNAAEILAQPDVDGGLVGGASLKAESFLAIVRAAADR